MLLLVLLSVLLCFTSRCEVEAEEEAAASGGWAGGLALAGALVTWHGKEKQRIEGSNEGSSMHVETYS